ncbi:glycosyltransferase [Pontibacter chinhatensis]|uniref:Dolichol-phosphate mannosyltransferase n=1 Tax=Pontibacter chinhatensis TaxID=1436961 RepID=A0A1I2WY72_9BACT|nr:glycosyltransferase [Pontibacter chinhatensis]SFH06284.1 dolichol-phosphate mannosyltransferase [Pontibacter chinhatensis]
MAKVSVIIPVYNEEENIHHLVSELNSYFHDEPRFSTEVVFVNDGSSDATMERLREAPHHAYTYKIISFSRNFGSHAALRAGIQKAQGDYITFMYADLQDPLTLVSRLYEEIESKRVDIAWAFRNSTAVSTSEKLFSSAYAMLMRNYAVPNFPKKGFDIVMFSKKVKACLDNGIENNSSVFIQILNFGFKQSGITYDKRQRLAGKSKWTLSKKIKLLIDSFVAFSFAPIRLVSFIGIVFFMLGIAWSGYIIFRKIFFDDLATGWPALLSILMVGFGITNISLGIIAEYLWRTLDASRKRPVFVIDEVVEEAVEPSHVGNVLLDVYK